MIIYNLVMMKGCWSIKKFLKKVTNCTQAITVETKLPILKINLCCIRFAWTRIFGLYVSTNWQWVSVRSSPVNG